MDLLFALPWVMVVIGLVIWLVTLVAYSVRLRGRKERLAWNDELRTAVWFINNNRTSNWIEGQIQRAARNVRPLDVDGLYPGDIPRSLYAVMAMVLLVAGLNFVKPSQNQNWMALKAALLARIEDLGKSTAPKPTDRINPPPVTDAAAQSIPALLQGGGSQSALPIGKLATINGPPGNEPLGQEPFGEPVSNPTRMGPPTTLKVQLELEKLSGHYNESKKKIPERRVPSRFYRGARKHQWNRDVIRPWRTVHVRHVSPRDDVAFARHDQELAGSSREVCTSKHLQETLSRCKGGRIGWCCTLDPRCVALNRSIDLLARYCPTHRG